MAPGLAICRYLPGKCHRRRDPLTTRIAGDLRAARELLAAALSAPRSQGAAERTPGSGARAWSRARALGARFACREGISQAGGALGGRAAANALASPRQGRATEARRVRT